MFLTTVQPSPEREYHAGFRNIRSGLQQFHCRFWLVYLIPLPLYLSLVPPSLNRWIVSLFVVLTVSLPSRPSNYVQYYERPTRCWATPQATFATCIHVDNCNPTQGNNSRKRAEPRPTQTQTLYLGTFDSQKALRTVSLWNIIFPCYNKSLSFVNVPNFLK